MREYTKAKRIATGSQVTWAAVLDPGDEVMATLSELARREGLSASAFTAIGAFREAVLGWIEGVPLVRAGVAAAAAGSLVGALTNDSGALFIQVGTLYLALVLGFAWTAVKSRRS